jgi:WD40 repeat protein
VTTGVQLRSITAHSAEGLSILFSPDGKSLASTARDNIAKLWDVASGTQLTSFNREAFSISSITFSPDGILQARGGSQATLEIWNVTNGTLIKSTEGRFSLYESSFSLDGKLLALPGKNGSIDLWNVGSGTQLKSLDAAVSVGSLTFSPDGKLLAGMNSQVAIVLWDVRSGAAPRLLEGASRTGTFSPEGKLLASVSQDHSIKVWDVASGTQLRSLKGFYQRVSSVAFSPDGKLLASANWQHIRLWDVASGIQSRSFTSHSDGVDAVAFSPEGKLLASGNSQVLELWDVTTGAKVKSLKGSTVWGNTVAFSRDGKLLASGNRVESLYPGKSWKTIKLWDVASGTRLKTFIGYSTHIGSFAFSPDGKMLASGGDGGSIEVWDVEKGTRLQSPEKHADKVYSVAFSPDSKLLASGSQDHTIRVWDVVNGVTVKWLGHPSIVSSVGFSPDGKLLASGSWDRTIKLWDVVNWTPPRSLEGHSSPIYSIAFSPNGQFLLSGSQDGTMKLWSVSDGQLLATLISFDQSDWLVVTPDDLFDGSPTAWQRSIWRFNNNTFDFAPVEAFFSEFYYPGLLTDILSGKRPKARAKLEEKDLRQPQVNVWRADRRATSASAVTTPTFSVEVEVLEAPADKKKSLPASGVQGVRLFRNGSLLKVWRGNAFALSRKDGCRQPQAGRVVCTIDVLVIAGKNRLTAYAFNRDNVKSSDSELVVTGGESLKRDRTLYILTIGINTYANAAYTLKYAVADAQDFGQELKKQQDKLKLYARTEVIALSDKEATKENILLALRQFSRGSIGNLPTDSLSALKRIKPSHPEDAVVIYFAGHGTANKDRFYLIPHDLGVSNEISALDEQSLKTLLERSISDGELESALEGVDAGQLLMVIDACNSGQALEAEEKRRGPMNSKGLAQLAYEKGMYILTASQSYQAALEVSRLGHGLLTYALLQRFALERRE